MIWSFPDWTSDRLLLNILWSGWIVLGARWEERDLVNNFGKPYELPAPGTDAGALYQDKIGEFVMYIEPLNKVAPLRTLRINRRPISVR